MIESQRSPFRPPSAQRTFPDDCHPPSGFQQFPNHSMIPLDVAPEFCLPKVSSCGGDGRIWAFLVTMPEAAVHEANRSEPTENQVRLPWQIPVVQTVPKSARMQCAAKYQLRFRIPAPNSGHHSRTNGRINGIDHGRSCIALAERSFVRISQRALEAIKEDTVIVQTAAQSMPERPRTKRRVRDTSLMGRFKRSAPISHLATRGSCLAISHPVITLPRAGLQPYCHD